MQIRDRLSTLLRESTVYGLAVVLQRVGGLILLPFCAHLFSPGEFGALGLALTTQALIGLFTIFAMDNSAHRWFWDNDDPSDRKCTISTWLWFQVLASALAGGLLALGAPWLANHMLADASAWPLFATLGASLPLSAISVVAGNWFRMQRRPGDALAMAAISAVVQIGGTLILLLWIDSGPVGYCIAHAAAGGVSSLFGLLLLRGWLDPTFLSLRRLSEMLRFALPLIPASLALWTMASFNRYALQSLAGPTEVGLFQFGSSIGMALTLATGAFQQAWGPFALSIHRQDDHGQVYARVLLWVAWSGGLLSCLLGASAPMLAWLLADPVYAPAAIVIGPVGFACCLAAVGYVLAIGPGLAKDNRPVASSMILGGAVAVLANLVLVPPWGLDGAAAAGLLGQGASIWLLYVLAQRRRFIPYSWRAATTIILLSLATHIMIRALIGVPGMTGQALRLAVCMPLGLAGWIALRNPRPGNASPR